MARNRAPKTMFEAFMAAYCAKPQPCFYACGALLPKDDSPESVAERRAHLEACPAATPVVKRAASVLLEVNRQHERAAVSAMEEVTHG